MQAQLIVPIPPKLNDQINLARSHWSKSASTKTKETKKVAVACHLQNIPYFPGRVWLDFCWQVSTRANDPDNIAASAKYIMDGMVNAGVITKDSLMVVQPIVVHRYEKGKDRAIVTISDEPIWILQRAKECAVV